MSFYPSYEEQFNSLDKDRQNILRQLPHLEEIEGWLLLSEVAELFSLAKSISSHEPVVCEIGAWRGKSAYVFGNAIKNKNGKLYSIDPFNGDGDYKSREAYHKIMDSMENSLFNDFQSTIKKYGLDKTVNAIPFSSEDARPKFPENSIDMLFIDGNHEYDAVKKDYELWSPLIPSGGIIVLHDVRAKHVDGPRRVMEEFISNGKNWRDARIVGEMGVAIKA
ncbi:MAG TPA: class I SAM-dependent methyltransferase [Candidatus Paceibacterota bacterium]|nr:class I SAM-dependent methyltransferase [Candidatus Paceibacterota bacterium]